MKFFNKRIVLGGLLSITLAAGLTVPVATSCINGVDDYDDRFKTGLAYIIDAVKKFGESLTDKVSYIKDGLKSGEITRENLPEVIAAAFESLTEPASKVLTEISYVLADEDTDLDSKVLLLQEAVRKGVVGGDLLAGLLGDAYAVLPDHFWDDYVNIFVALYAPDYDFSTRVAMIEAIINDGYLNNQQTLTGISDALETFTGSSTVADAGIAALKLTLSNTIDKLDALDAINQQLTPELTETVSATLEDALERIVAVNYGEAGLEETIEALRKDFNFLDEVLAELLKDYNVLM